MTDLSTTGALDHLVNQFSDPLSFLRELVQNAIDAGSRDVDVRFEHQRSDGDQGTTIIHVDDYGEGMDREVIDKRLTRLFSSAKEEDLTKIGRFGIGFASVFALEPDAVCVDTSRAGERWRVLFHADRTFTRIKRDDPMEGTRVQVIKRTTEEAFRDLRARGTEVVRYWCKHVEAAQVRVDGESVREPLALGLPIEVVYKEEGTEIVAGYTRDGSSSIGFYNKGLTLHERDEGPHERVAVKISSRYLEHTLTRDKVLEDDNYEKAMTLVHRLCTVDLLGRLFAEIERCVDVEAHNQRKNLQELAAWVLTRGLPLPKGTEERIVARTVGNEGARLAACRRAAAKDKLLLGTGQDHLCEALAEEGHLILDNKTVEWRFAGALLGGQASWAHDRWCLPQLLATADRGRWWTELVDATEALLQGAGFKVKGVEVGHLGASSERLVAVTQRKLATLTLMDEGGASHLSRALLGRGRYVILNASSSKARRLAELAATEADLAAYALVKLFFLADHLDGALDGELAARAAERRWASRHPQQTS